MFKSPADISDREAIPWQTHLEGGGPLENGRNAMFGHKRISVDNQSSASTWLGGCAGSPALSLRPVIC